MKKATITYSVLLSVAVVAGVAQVVGQPKLQELGLDELLPLLEEKQGEYFAEYGEYWQGLSTKKGLSHKPPSATHSWMDLQLTPEENVELKVDTYYSEAGHGYTVTAITTYTDEICTQVFNSGSLVERAQPEVCESILTSSTSSGGTL